MTESNPEVDAWFAALEHPLKPVMQRLREIMLEADADIHTVVMYGTVQFVYGSPMCGFVQVKDKRQVSLMFNAAGQLHGEFPHLEGNKVKYLRLKSMEDVDAIADELRTITRAWHVYKSGPTTRNS